MTRTIVNHLPFDDATYHRARRSFVGAVGWALLGVGVASLALPLPLEVPALLAGSALLAETNPEVSEFVDGVVHRARETVNAFSRQVWHQARTLGDRLAAASPLGS
jgi:hypothetical protein